MAQRADAGPYSRASARPIARTGPHDRRPTAPAVSGVAETADPGLPAVLGLPLAVLGRLSPP